MKKSTILKSGSSADPIQENLDLKQEVGPVEAGQVDGRQMEQRKGEIARKAGPNHKAAESGGEQKPETREELERETEANRSEQQSEH